MIHGFWELALVVQDVRVCTVLEKYFHHVIFVPVARDVKWSIAVFILGIYIESEIA